MNGNNYISNEMEAESPVAHTLYIYNKENES